MADTRWPRWLDRITPRSGRIRCEDGEYINEGDYYALNYRYNLLRQTIKNGAVEFGLRTNVASGDSTDPLYFYLDIPAGRRFYLWQRTLSLTEGVYEIDLVSVDSATGGNIAHKIPLAQGASGTVQTELYTGVTPTGTPTVIMELPLVDTGVGVGASRLGGAAANDAALKSFDGGSEPVLIRVTRQDAGAYTASITLIAWEEAIDGV